MELTYFSFGLITAIGLQLTYTAAFMAVVSTFKDSKYFGIACGIMVSGGGIGAFATNHMLAWILSLWTLREALVVQAAFLLHAWFSAALFYWVDETSIIQEQLEAPWYSSDKEPNVSFSFGIACGIMVSGGGIGAFATNHMLAWILSLWTLREALVVQAAFLLHAWFSAALFYWVDETSIIQEQLEASSAKKGSPFRDITRLWFLCPIFMILTPASHRPRVQKKAVYANLPAAAAEEEEDCAAKSRAICSSIGKGLKQLFSRKVWTNLGFITFILSNGLCAAGVVIPWTFIYDYFYQVWLAGVPAETITSEVDAQIAWYPSLIGLGSCCGQVIIGIISSNITKKAVKSSNFSVQSGDADVSVASRGRGSCCRPSNLNILFACICLFNGIVTIAFTFLPIPSALGIDSPDLLILNTSQGSVLAFASFMIGLSDGGFMTLLGLMLENEVEEQYFPAALGICLCVTGAFNFVGTVVGGHIFDVYATYTPAMLLAAVLSFAGFLLFVFSHCIRPRPLHRQKDVQSVQGDSVVEIAF